MTSKIYNLIVLLFVSLVAIGQNRDANTSLISIGGLGSIDSGSVTFTNNYLPFIKVIIDNVEYDFLFDTGAELCILSKDISKRALSLGEIVASDLDGNEQNAQIYETDIQIGNTSFEKLRCVKLDLKSIFGTSCVKIDGVIGQNLIRKLNWHFDSERGVVFWSKLPFVIDSTATQLDLEYYGDLPLTKVGFDNLSFYVLVDTGFDGLLELNSGGVKKSKKYKKSAKSCGEGEHQITIGGASTQKVTVATLDTIGVGSGYLTNVPTYISKSKPLLGSLLFKNNNVTFNFTEDKIVLFPFQNLRVKIQSFGVGLGLNENSAVEIVFIWMESEAYKQGLRLGQRIAKINGVDVSQITNEYLCALKVDAIKNGSLELHYLEKGKEKNILLKK